VLANWLQFLLGGEQNAHLKTISGIKWDLTSLKKTGRKRKKLEDKGRKNKRKNNGIDTQEWILGHDCKYCILSRKF
jgi:hypothetical protein